MKSETVATNPLRSGQLINRTALVFIVFRVVLRAGRASRVSDSGSTALQIFQDLTCGIRPGTARQTGARMGSAPAQIQVRKGRAIARPVEQRTHGEELVERQLAMEDL